MRIAVRSFLYLVICEDGWQVKTTAFVLYFGAISLVGLRFSLGEVQSHTFRQERESDQSRCLEASDSVRCHLVMRACLNNSIAFGGARSFFVFRVDIFRATVSARRCFNFCDTNYGI